MVNKDQKKDIAGTCYVDVTQLVHWSGKLTGIPRVMYELAVRFSNEPNVKYVSWVRQLGVYCEVDYETSIAQREGLSYAGSSPVDSKGRVLATSRMSHLAKRVATKAVNGTKYIHKAAPDKIREIVFVRKARSYKRVNLGLGDSVFIPWGEWWDKNFLDMLVEAAGRGAKLSTFIHDVGPMVAPHLSGNSASLADYCATVVPVCEEVFVNSKFTRDTLKSWLLQNKYEVPQITAVILGDDFAYNTAVRPKDKAFKEAGLNGGDYILTVGTVELKKNHIFYYYVYKLAAERGVDLPPLVIAGRHGWGTETNIRIMKTDPELKHKFVFLSDVSDEELAWLYANTQFSLFASMYEGWGLPLSESLFHGVPAISARSTSLIEIGEGVVDRFTQASTDECLSAMQQMLDPKYRVEKRNQIKKAYKPATWDKCYEDIKKELRKKEMV